MFVGQEILDALPVHQFEYTADGWRERLVDVDDGTGEQVTLTHTAVLHPPYETPTS